MPSRLSLQDVTSTVGDTAATAHLGRRDVVSDNPTRWCRFSTAISERARIDDPGGRLRAIVVRTPGLMTPGRLPPTPTTLRVGI